MKPIHYSASDPDDQHDTAIFAPYQLGDLLQWREAEFDAKDWKAVLESYIWRCFQQMSQALAVLQNKIGLDREKRDIMLHRDIKP